MKYDLEQNVGEFVRQEGLARASFRNNQTIVFEIPAGNLDSTKYAVMSPSINGSSNFWVNLKDGALARFPDDKGDSLQDLVKPLNDVHPITRLEVEADKIYQEMLAPLELKSVGVRNWKSLLATGAITLTYPVSVPAIGLTMYVQNKIRSDPKFGLGLACLAITPLIFLRDVKEVINPSNKRFEVTNKDLLKEQAAVGTPKIYFGDSEHRHLPTICFSNGIAISDKYLCLSSNSRTYAGCKYSFEVASPLQNQLFDVAKKLETEKRELEVFSKDLDASSLRTFLSRRL